VLDGDQRPPLVGRSRLRHREIGIAWAAVRNAGRLIRERGPAIAAALDGARAFRLPSRVWHRAC
jgi:hypothetical protein